MDDIVLVNKQLTERDEKFLEILFSKEVKGDLRVAKRLAGYPQSMPVKSIVNRLKEEIIEATQLYLAQNAPLAVISLVNIIASDQPVPDSKNILIAAKEILDRAGIVKTEKKEVNHTGGIALLPPKN